MRNSEATDIKVAETGVDGTRLAEEKAGRNPDLPANHPINALSKWRKFGILVTLAFSGWLGQFSVAIILVAFPPMSASFKRPIGDIANTVGFMLLGIAFGPLFWNPLSRTLGRRPVYLLGSVLFLPCAIWMALARTYVAFSVGRVFAGLTISFSQTVPPSTVSDIFLPSVIGSKMAVYVVAIVCAPAMAPFFCGLIVHAGSWRNLFWFILGLGGLQLILYFFLVPETQWVEDTTAIPQSVTGDKDTIIHAAHEEVAHINEHGVENVRGGHVGVAWYPWQHPREYMRICFGPIIMLKYFTIIVPSIYYGLSFGWLVGITVVTPQTLGPPPYSFAVIPLGCSFLAFGIGAVLGFWCGGIVGDKTVAYYERKKGTRQPEDRLWAVFPMMPLMLAAMIIIAFALHRHLHWIALLIGGALWFFCISVITGLLQTYVLECYLPQGMDSMAVFNFWRMLFGFIVPFFVYDWGVKHGWLECYITQGALSAVLGTLLCAFLLWKGRAIRAKQNMPIWE